MYDYRCKNCENLGQCMPMMYLPMMNMPMYENQMPMFDRDDEDLKIMYPKIYTRIYPMVKQHCDMMVSHHGTMYCPSMYEMEYICNDVCDKYEKYYKDDEDDEHHEHRNDDDDMRQRRRFSRGGIGDLARILLIGDLLGRRRRRRFFDHGFDHEFDHEFDHGHHHGY